MDVSEQQSRTSKVRERQSLPVISEIIATGCYTGYIPWASGTFGSLAGILIYLIPGMDSIAVLLPAVCVFFFLGSYCSSIVASIIGHQLSNSAAFAKSLLQPGKHGTADPSIIVIDEIVGMWISLLLVPKTWFAITIAFVAFRFFDIVKPPPAARLERIPNGWGIMLDDAIAGVYACIVTHLALYVQASFLPGLL